MKASLLQDDRIMKMEFVSQNKELNRGLITGQQHRLELPVDSRKNNRAALKAHVGEAEESRASRERKLPREKTNEKQQTFQLQEDASEMKNISNIQEAQTNSFSKIFISSKVLDLRPGRLTSALPGHRLESATTGVYLTKMRLLKLD